MIGLSFCHDAFEVESAYSLEQFLAVLLDRERRAHDSGLGRDNPGEAPLTLNQWQSP